jgi:hypothetical protein
VETAVADYKVGMLARMEDAVTATNAVQDILLSPQGPGAPLSMVSSRAGG